jgi:DNA-directed RNA polymerase subunit H
MVKLMTDEDRRFNVLNHVNVPLHEIVPQDEEATVLGSYQVTKDQLPKILVTDPAARAAKLMGGDGETGASPGNIIKITRESSTAGVHVAYRSVVSAL